jgi:hypothetical protein
MRRISAAAFQRREVPQPIQVLSWRAGFMFHAEKLKSEGGGRADALQLAQQFGL